MSSKKSPVMHAWIKGLDPEAPLEEPYKPLPPAPLYDRFYDACQAHLETLQALYYTPDCPPEEVVISSGTLERKTTDPVNFMFLPAVMAGDVLPTLEHVSWNPDTVCQPCQESLNEMFDDLGSLADDMGLETTFRNTGGGIVFLVENSDPRELIRLFRRHRTHFGYPTLDQDGGKSILTRSYKTLHSLIERYTAMYVEKNETILGLFHTSQLDLDILAPQTYLSAAHAFAAMNRSSDRGMIPVSEQYLINLLREERGLPVPEGLGLVRQH